MRYAMGTGALRFGLVLAGFCAVFVAGMIAEEMRSGHEGWVGNTGSVSDVLLTGGRIFLALLLVGLPVVVLGALLGAMELPMARRLRPATAALLAGALVAGTTLLVAPWPFADEVHGLAQHLLFWLLPSAALGLAAAWEAAGLSRRLH